MPKPAADDKEYDESEFYKAPSYEMLSMTADESIQRPEPMPMRRIKPLKSKFVLPHAPAILMQSQYRKNQINQNSLAEMVCTIAAEQAKKSRDAKKQHTSSDARKTAENKVRST